MSCLHPITILSPESRLLRKCIAENKSFEYYYKHSNTRRNLLLDPAPLISERSEYYSLFRSENNPPFRSQNVPCGNCELCDKRKVNDYMIRCHFEWLHTVYSLRGSVYFVTLTYADEVLPKVHGEPCFDSEHIKKFLKRFRRLLEDNGYDNNIKYFIVSEYGGEFGRPHYHGLLFMPSWEHTISNQFRIVEYLAKSWTKVCDRNKRYNQLFDCQRVDAQLLQDDGQIRYVCKYIGKQVGAKQFDSLNLEYRYRRNHWQSIGLGMCMYQYCERDIFDKGTIKLGLFEYSLPLYYRIKLKREFFCYHEDGSIIYQPTDYALTANENRFFDMLEEYKKLSLLNVGFPKCPSELYDPLNLTLLRERLSLYSLDGFNSFDFGGMDNARNEDVSNLVELFNTYCDEVSLYYRDRDKATAHKWRNDQREHYEKQIGLR